MLSDRVGCCWVDLLSQKQQEVEISILKVALLDVLVPSHVLLELFLSRLVSNDGWELCLLYNGKSVVI